jgi:NAD(P)H-flavin reductase
MKTYLATVQRESLKTDGLVHVDAHALPPVQPGQYFRAFAPASAQVLPVAIFPYSRSAETLSLSGAFTAVLQPGDSLLLQGPYGNGFTEALKTRRLLLLSAHSELENRLYFLMQAALQSSADIAWVSETCSLPLPPQVELLKPAELHDAILWADACATALPLHEISTLIEGMRLSSAEASKFEVLIDTPLACGNARCGVCSVQTKKGWQLACKDGPVFHLGELQYE